MVERLFSGFEGGDGIFERGEFTGLGGATGVSIFSNDPAGLGYDNISTDPLEVIPLPAPLALLAGGIGALVLTRRRGTSRV